MFMCPSALESLFAFVCNCSVPFCVFFHCFYYFFCRSSGAEHLEEQTEGQEQQEDLNKSEEEKAEHESTEKGRQTNK